jgi:hypothetical protein
MITIKAGRDKLIYLEMTHVLNFGPNKMAAGFDPKTSHVLVLLAIDKAAL